MTKKTQSKLSTLAECWRGCFDCQCRRRTFTNKILPAIIQVIIVIAVWTILKSQMMPDDASIIAQAQAEAEERYVRSAAKFERDHNCSMGDYMRGSVLHVDGMLSQAHVVSPDPNQKKPHFLNVDVLIRDVEEGTMVLYPVGTPVNFGSLEVAFPGEEAESNILGDGSDFDGDSNGTQVEFDHPDDVAKNFDIESIEGHLVPVSDYGEGADTQTGAAGPLGSILLPGQQPQPGMKPMGFEPFSAGNPMMPPQPYPHPGYQAPPVYPGHPMPLSLGDMGYGHPALGGVPYPSPYPHPGIPGMPAPPHPYGVPPQVQGAGGQPQGQSHDLVLTRKPDGGYSLKFNKGEGEQGQMSAGGQGGARPGTGPLGHTLLNQFGMRSRQGGMQGRLQARQTRQTGQIGPNGQMIQNSQTGQGFSEQQPGQNGPSVVQGQTSLSGQTGQMGQAPGQSGQAGISGQAGVSGQTGLVGQTGATGQTAQMNQTATAGQSGILGQTGATGTTGQLGSQTSQTGESSLTGISGQSGLSGQAGTTLQVGQNSQVSQIGLSAQTGQANNSNSDGASQSNFPTATITPPTGGETTTAPPTSDTKTSDGTSTTTTTISPLGGDKSGADATKSDSATGEDATKTGDADKKDDTASTTAIGADGEKKLEGETKFDGDSADKPTDSASSTGDVKSATGTDTSASSTVSLDEKALFADGFEERLKKYKLELLGPTKDGDGDDESLTGQFKINNPDICKGKDTIDILYLIASKPQSMDVRIRIRDGHVNPAVLENVKMAHVFLVGKTNSPNFNKNIDSEKEKYNDIAMGEYMDHAENATRKAVSAWRWAKAYCPQATHVMYVDESIFVDTDKLVTGLIPTASKLGDDKHLLCPFMPGIGIPRQGSNAVKKPLFPTSTHFKPYCKSYATLMSRQAMLSLLAAAEKAPSFPAPDVYLFGYLPYLVGDLGVYDVGSKRAFHDFGQEVVACYEEKKDRCPLVASKASSSRYETLLKMMKERMKTPHTGYEGENSVWDLKNFRRII